MSHVRRNKSLILKKHLFTKSSNVIRKIFLFLILFSIFPTVSFAQSPTQSKIPSSEGLEKINDKVDELKNKIASRVAQLNLVEKRGIIGIVQDVSDTQVTVSDLNGRNRIIDVDEFTKFSGEDDSFGISDIKKGSKISILGLYNKESRRLLARFINEITIPLFLYGVVSEKDDENFTVMLTTEDSEYSIDIEKVTKTFEYSDGELKSSGFSKIETIQNALVIGFSDPKEKTKITASKIIIFPNLPKNPKIQIVEDVKEMASPSPTRKPAPTTQ